MTTTPNVEESTLLAVQKAHDAKLAVEKAAAFADMTKGDALTALTRAKLDHIEIDDDGFIVKATVVRPTTSSVDYGKLATLLTEEQWDAITEPKVSKALLTEAVEAGTIDPDIVTSCTTFGEGTPHIRWSVQVSKGVKRWSAKAKIRKVVRS